MMDSLRLCLITVLCTGAIAAQPLAGAVDARSDELGHFIAALPAQSEEQQLKKSTLQWAYDESAYARAAGRDQEADALLDDVKRSLASDMGKRESAPATLFPPIPDFPHNPVAQQAMASLDNILAAGVDNDPSSVMNDPKEPGDFNNKIAPQAMLLVESLCHPQSPRAGDPRIVPILLHHMETLYRTHMPGSKWVGDFGHSNAMAETYLMLKTVYPSLILPSRQRDWETSIKAAADTIMERRADIFRACKPGTAYPNADTKLISALVYADMALGHPEYREAADAGERLMSTAIYPDGGWAYIGEQNESYTYHAIDIQETCRLWQVTNNPVALKNVQASRAYFALSIEPPGVAEYSTAPSWKHYWNQIKAPEAALMQAGVLGDQDSMRIARFGEPNGDLIVASFYRADVQPSPSPDNYFVYDRNIQGPRGRFGLFSFSGTAREMPDEDRGKSTYAGCMVLYPHDQLPKGVSEGYPLDSALDDAGSEVLTKPAGEKDAADTLAREEKNESTVARDFAAITTTYRLAPYHGPSIDWTGQQMWLFTPQRLVGLVRVTSQKEQDAFGISGKITFVGSEPKNQNHREFETSSNSIFSYGGLVTQCRAQNFGSIVTDYPTQRPDTARIRLLDPRAVHEQGGASIHYSTIHYSAGESHYYLVEFHPLWCRPAESVSLLVCNDGLSGLDLTEGGNHFRLIHNATTAAITYQATLPADARSVWLHHSGEQYRPAWIGQNHTEELVNGPEALTTVGGKVSIPIAAGGHIVLNWSL